MNYKNNLDEDGAICRNKPTFCVCVQICLIVKITLVCNYNHNVIHRFGRLTFNVGNHDQI